MRGEPGHITQIKGSGLPPLSVVVQLEVGPTYHQEQPEKQEKKSEEMGALSRQAGLVGLRTKGKGNLMR